MLAVPTSKAHSSQRPCIIRKQKMPYEGMRTTRANRPPALRFDSPAAYIPTPIGKRSGFIVVNSAFEIRDRRLRDFCSFPLAAAHPKPSQTNQTVNEQWQAHTQYTHNIRWFRGAGSGFCNKHLCKTSKKFPSELRPPPSSLSRVPTTVRWKALRFITI